jgi:Spy/CpxP family protein refolding chaperone
MLMRALHRYSLPLSLAVAIPTIGCSGAAASQPTASTQSTTAVHASVAPGAHGMVKLVAEALADVPLDEAQRTRVESLAASAEARHAESLVARKDLMLSLAAQVDAGRIDRAALEPKISDLAAANAKAQPADRAAFEQLHALLTPDQRAAFVNALEARLAERRGEPRAKHPLQQWAADLQLSDSQKAEIKAALHERFQGMAHHRSRDDAGPMGAGHRGAKVLAAFKQDHFVMDEVAPVREGSQLVPKMTDRILALAETALPVLTPAQRALAAQKIRQKAESLDELGSHWQ